MPLLGQAIFPGRPRGWLLNIPYLLRDRIAGVTIAADFDAEGQGELSLQDHILENLVQDNNVRKLW